MIRIDLNPPIDFNNDNLQESLKENPITIQELNVPLLSGGPIIVICPVFEHKYLVQFNSFKIWTLYRLLEAVWRAAYNSAQWDIDNGLFGRQAADDFLTPREWISEYSLGGFYIDPLRRIIEVTGYEH